MTGTEFQTYLVGLAMEAYDATQGNEDAPRYFVQAQRENFLEAVTERMAQAATVYVCDVETARGQPTDAEADRAMAHEASLRAGECTEENPCATCCGGGGSCDEPDESMDGDHESALASVYGEND